MDWQDYIDCLDIIAPKQLLIIQNVGNTSDESGKGFCLWFRMVANASDLKLVVQPVERRQVQFPGGNAASDDAETDLFHRTRGSSKSSRRIHGTGPNEYGNRDVKAGEGKRNSG